MNQKSIQNLLISAMVIASLGVPTYWLIRPWFVKSDDLIPLEGVTPVSADSVMVQTTNGQSVPLPVALKFLECRMLLLQNGTSTLPEGCRNF